MKIIWVIVWIIVLVGIAFWIYKTWTMFDLQKTFWTSQKEEIELKFKDAQQKADTMINSGKQYVWSGAQQIMASGEALLQQKKLEAEAYLLEQKEKLKAEAQRKLEEEAKKKINWVFSGR